MCHKIQHMRWKQLPEDTMEGFILNKIYQENESIATTNFDYKIE